MGRLTTRLDVRAAATAVLVASLTLGLGAGCSKRSGGEGSSPTKQPSDIGDQRSPIPDESRQLIVATTTDWSSPTAELRLYERTAPTAPWRAVGEPWPAVVGKTGLAWGRGLHGDGAPTGHDGPTKREGDGAAPAGVFALGAAYGYGAAPPEGTRVPYTQVTESWRCVDDPRSTRYNRIIDEGTVTPDWQSAEQMRRDDVLYTWVIDVAHNAAPPSPGGGSCIFLHVWREAGQPTVGCTAMPRDRIEALLGRLDPAAAPVYVALPLERYRTLASAWRLPPR